MGVYTTKEKVIVEDIGKDFKMNNRSFLRILQEAANRASADVGYGIADIEKNKTSWVLLYWRMAYSSRHASDTIYYRFKFFIRDFNKS